MHVNDLHSSTYNLRALSSWLRAISRHLYKIHMKLRVFLFFLVLVKYLRLEILSIDGLIQG